MEEWRPVTDFPNYEISSDGNVRRVGGIVERLDGVKRRLPNRNLAQHAWGKRHRYRRVTFWSNGKQYDRYVHRLVAEAFIGPCPPGHEVNHKNGNRTDCRAENLEYVTHGQNLQHFYLFNRGLISGSNHWNAKLREVDVSLIRLACEHGFPQSYLAKLFDVRQATIEKIHLGLRWRAPHGE